MKNHKIKRYNQIDIFESQSYQEKWIFSRSVKWLLALTVIGGLFLVFSAVTYASEITPEKVIELVNIDRKEEGLDELVVNSKLNQAAQLKARHLIDNDYFAHISPDGVTPWHWIEKVGYDYKYAGENLAMDFSSAESQHKAWMKSKTHMQNIMHKHYHEIGVAVLREELSGKETIVTVQMFGATAASIAQKIVEQKDQNESVSGIAFEQNKVEILMPENQTVTNIGEVPLVAQAGPNETCELFDGGAKLETLMADSLGMINYQIKNIPEGRHKLYLHCLNSDKISNEVWVEVDQTAPIIGKEGIIATRRTGTDGGQLALVYRKGDISELTIDDEGSLYDFKQGGEGKLSAVVPLKDSYRLIAKDRAGNVTKATLYVKGFEKSQNVAVGDRNNSQLISSIKGISASVGGGDYIETNFMIVSFIMLTVLVNLVLIGNKSKFDGFGLFGKM